MKIAFSFSHTHTQQSRKVANGTQPWDTKLGFLGTETVHGNEKRNTQLGHQFFAEDMQ